MEKRRFFTFSFFLSLFSFFFQQVRGQSTPLDAFDESQVMILKKEANGCCDGFFFFFSFFQATHRRMRENLDARDRKRERERK